MAELIAAVTLIMLPKDINKQLTNGLRHDEFRCRCQREDCHYTLISNRLIQSYTFVRNFWGRPLIINSGFRCQKHNEFVHGVIKSSHTTGHGIDISTAGMTEKEKRKLYILAQGHFDYVKIYANFIHCQIND